MSKHSQGNLFLITADELTHSSEARPASQAALPDNDEAPPMIAGSGLTFCAWCLKSVPCGCWPRTLAESLALTLREWNSASGLRVSLRIEVTTSCPSNWLLRTLARRIEESECGSWPCVTASTGGQNATAPTNHERSGKHGTNLKGVVMAWPSPRATDGSKGGPNQRGSKGDLMLPSAVQMWPTPTLPSGGRQPKGGMDLTGQTPDGKKRQVDLNFAVKQWPTPHANCSTGAGHQGRDGGLNLQTAVVQGLPWATPTARDHKSIHASEATYSKNSRPLSEQVGRHDPENPSANGKNRASLRLNHKWVAQLMGFPPDWLEGVEWPR